MVNHNLYYRNHHLAHLATEMTKTVVKIMFLQCRECGCSLEGGRFLSSMNEALACGGYMSHWSSISELIYIERKLYASLRRSLSQYFSISDSYNIVIINCYVSLKLLDFVSTNNKKNTHPDGHTNHSTPCVLAHTG